MQLRWKSRLRMVYGHLRDKESSPYRAELCLFWGDLWKKASITSSFILVWTAYSSWLLINYSVTTDLLLIYYKPEGGDYRNTTDLLLIYYKSEEDDYLSTTDLLLNYVITVLWTIRTSDPLLFMLDALANASRPRNKLRPVHRFRMRRTSKTGLPLAARREILRYALARILMHAVKTDPARFWRVFGWFVACFTGFPSETPSEALRRCTQRMLW